MSVTNFRKHFLLIFEIFSHIFRNLKNIFKLIKEKTLFNFYLNIRSLSKNIDNLKEFLAHSLNGNFSVIVVTEIWCAKTANKNSLLEAPNCSVLHRTTKNQKRGGICMFTKV